MKNIGFLLLTLLVTACGGTSSEQKITAGDQFFENTMRTTVSKKTIEARGIARLDMGCTGFFIKNSQNKNFVATARHCMNYRAAEWCGRNSIRDYSSGKKLNCLQVAVGDEFHDTVILEVENSTRDRSQDFELGAFLLESKMRLQMLGFPADKFNTAGDLKLSQNCWVQNPASTSIYQMEVVRDDQVFKHNCSTYGGNSGGPMFLEGTRLAIGIPDSYKVNDYTSYSSTASAQGVRMVGFVKDFRGVIEDLGMAIQEVAPKSEGEDFLTEGTYQSPTLKCTATVSKVVYDTTDTPTKITASFLGEDCSIAQDDFLCQKSKCENQNRDSVKIIDQGRFTYIGAVFSRVQD
jgi:Trypsin